MIAGSHDGAAPAVVVDRLVVDAPSRSEVLDSYVGSPLYGVIAEHEAAVVAVLLLGLWYAVWGRRPDNPRMAAYRRLPPTHRLLAWLLAITSVLHAGLVLGHEPSGWTLAYGASAAGTGWTLSRLLRGRRWRLVAALVLTGLLVGYAVTLLQGEAPDQIGLVSKLVELGALAITVLPVRPGRARRVAVNVAVSGAAAFVALAGWVGAFASGDGGHHLGETPHPGVLLPAGDEREPTAEEIHAAEDLFVRTAAALEPYRDIDVAAAAGYEVAGVSGLDFHADNPVYKHDGLVLDPARPETLVYAVGGDGEAVLLGAMFQMEGIGVPGPAVAGPLTVWHAHDHVCFTLPFAIAGLTSPYGLCPLGSITIPVTNEMLHLWIVPGLDDPFGDLDDQVIKEYVG